MKTILYLTHTYIPEDSRILKAIGCAQKIGFSVVGFGVNAVEKKHIVESDQSKDICSFFLLSRNLKFLPRFMRNCLEVIEITVKMFFRSISVKPDLIHCNDATVLPLAVCVKFFTGAQLIYDAHELESNRNGLSKISGKLTLFMERFFWRKVDALIVVSSSIDRWYQDNVGRKPSVVILNSPILSPEAGQFDNNYLRRKFDIPLGRKIFIYIGILAPGRGVEIILDVFRSRGVMSHVVFLGYGELSGDLIEQARIHSNIHYHSAVSHDNVVAIASSANFGFCLIQNVSLSDYFSLPNKLFEYIFAGTPVIASNFPEISKLVRVCNAGVCCELDVKSIKDIVRRVEEENLEFQFDFDSLQGYSWSAQEAKLSNFYLNLTR